MTALHDLGTLPGMSAGLVIAMPLRQWGLIDGCMDNDVSVETVNDDRQRADLARSVRAP
ncbi:hypothetical protein AB0F88_28555 [Streptosporangium sp. NPDC023963]|uniref:hypothetical protein n=1 Tax=Streptosporangium sp. NPDC023963 TaxID=3155608 RepID=UPI0034136B9C